MRETTGEPQCGVTKSIDYRPNKNVDCVHDVYNIKTEKSRGEGETGTDTVTRPSTKCVADTQHGHICNRFHYNKERSRAQVHSHSAHPWTTKSLWVHVQFLTRKYHARGRGPLNTIPFDKKHLHTCSITAVEQWIAVGELVGRDMEKVPFSDISTHRKSGRARTRLFPLQRVR